MAENFPYTVNYNLTGMKKDIEDIEIEPRSALQNVYTIYARISIKFIRDDYSLEEPANCTIVIEKTTTEEIETIELTPTFTGTSILFIYDLNRLFTNLKSVTFNILGNASKNIYISTSYPFINVYNLSFSNLVDIKNSFTNEYIDLNDYIISFYRYPFNIPNSSLTNVNTIQVGNYAINSTSQVISTQFFSMFDELKIEGLTKSSADINNTTIKIFLPFYGQTSLSSKYINSDIQIEAIIDILTNKLIYFIMSNDIPIDIINVDNLAQPIFYNPTPANSYYNNFNVKNSFMSNTTLSIIIEQNEPLNDYNYIGNEWHNLKDLEGYTEINIEMINLTGLNCYDIEKQILKNILKEGFYI